ncbi:MAG: Eukaryotic translation initiation factor eIF-1 [Trizodia sp. TS-e1964]|nr:MAG: Eukaryotic translation initiation factor eIF-1 [Trizodia sp. TS-e1964]
MSGAITQAAAKVGQAAAKNQAKNILGKGAKRDPELYKHCLIIILVLLQILLGIMTGAFGLAGYYFGYKPTSAVSESSVKVAQGSMPWQVNGQEADKAKDDFKYQYHPGGDPKNPARKAPSALHSVIIPNVNLPKKDSQQAFFPRTYEFMSIENLRSFDPFAEADEEPGETNQSQNYIHIRIQQRNGRKTLTTVQGLPKKFDQKKILKVIKKKFACNGTIVNDTEMGEVIQLQGDQRKDVQEFLVDKDGLELDAKTIKVHGF